MSNQAISDALAKLFIGAGNDRAESVFYYSLLMQYGVRYKEDVPTACVDRAGRVYVGAAFCGWPLSQRAGVLAHEARHIYQRTGARVGSRDHKLYNIASDLVINEWLMASGYKMPEGGITMASPWPPEIAEELRAVFQPRETTEEEVYEILSRHAESMGGFEFSEDVEEGGMDNPAVDKIKVAAAAQAARAAGNLPGWLERECSDILREKTPWPDAIRDWLTETADADLSWGHPDRTVLANYGILMPDWYSESIGELVVVVDTSGSMDEELLGRCSAHISAGLALVRPSKLHVIYCDADINKVETLDKPTSVTLKLIGGGGTDFRPPFDWVRENVTNPAGLVYFTDGYGSFPEEPTFRTLWCIMEGCHTEVPFGRVVEIS